MASIGRNLSIAAQVAKINRNLLKVADACEPEILKTMKMKALRIAVEQRSIAPVDPESEVPGAVRDSVRVEEGTNKKGRNAIFIKAGGKTTLRKGKGKDYDIARANEFGTEDMAPNWGFFAIWRARRKEARKAVKATVKKAVRKVFP
jgi:hypothetical protein